MGLYFPHGVKKSTCIGSKDFLNNEKDLIIHVGSGT